MNQSNTTTGLLVMRLLAGVLAFSAWWGVGGSSHRSVVLFAVPGADPAEVRALTDSGLLPSMARLLERAVRSRVEQADPWRSDGLWAAAVGLGPAELLITSATVQDEQPFWAGPGIGSVLTVGAPPVEGVEGDGSVDGLSQAASLREGSSILGGSQGSLVRNEDILGVTVPWPYQDFGAALSLAAEGIEVGEWSEPIRTDTDAGTERVQAYRLDLERYWLTPVYLEDGEGLVAGLPSPLGVSGAKVDPMLQHATSLTAERLEMVLGALREGTSDLVVYREALLEFVAELDHALVPPTAGGAGDPAASDATGSGATASEGTAERTSAPVAGSSILSPRRLAVWRTLDRRLGRVLEAAGEDVLVVLLVGGVRPATGTELILADGRGQPATGPRRSSDAVATLRYVSGCERVPGDSGRVPSVVRTRFAPAHAAPGTGARVCSGTRAGAVPGGPVPGGTVSDGSVSGVTVPDVTVPDVTVPDVAVPDIAVPDTAALPGRTIVASAAPVVERGLTAEALTRLGALPRSIRVPAP